MKELTKKVKGTFMNKQNPEQVRSNCRVFRVLVLVYLISELIQESITSTDSNKISFSLDYPSKLLGVIIVSGVFICFELLMLLIAKIFSRYGFQISYMVFMFLCLSLIIQEFSREEQRQPYPNSFVPDYQFTVFKMAIVGFISNNLLICFVLWTDAAYLFARIPEFHSAEIISPVIVSLIAPAAIIMLRLSSTWHCKTFDDMKDKTQANEEPDWVKEVLTSMSNGLAIIRLDKTLKYVNPELMTLLNANEENVLELLMQLPNQELASQFADGTQQIPSTCSSSSKLPVDGGSGFKRREAKAIGKTHYLSHRKSIFHVEKQNDKNENFPRERSKSNSMIDLGIEAQNSSRQLNPIKLIFQEPSNQDKSGPPSLNSTQHIPLVSYSSKTKPSTLADRKARTPEMAPRKLHRSISSQKFSSLFPSSTRIASLLRKSSGSSNALEPSSHTSFEKISDDQALRSHLIPVSIKDHLIRGYKSTNLESVGDVINAMIAKANVPNNILEPKASSYTGLNNNSKANAIHFLSQHTEEAEEEEIGDTVYVSSFRRLGEDKMKYFDVEFKSVVSNGEKLVLLLVKDTTYNHMAQRLQTMNLKKNETLAMVSHEYRTPLNGIISMLELLSEKVQPLLEEKYVRPALINSKRLLRLVNDILDFHQLQNSKLSLVNGPCFLQELIQSVFKVLEIPASMRGLELNYKIDSDVPSEIVTDPARLEQIVLNLASNALKFTEKGGICIQVSTPKPGKVTIQVRDTGIGIKDTNLSKLFRMFGKVDLGTKSSLNPTGVGLGLVISNALSKSLNSDESEGGLKVESVYGKGSCFYFTIDDLACTEQENFYFSNEDHLSICSTPNNKPYIKPTSIIMSPVSSRSKEVYSFVNSYKGNHLEKPFGAKLQVLTGQRDFEHTVFGSLTRRAGETQHCESLINVPNEISNFVECAKCSSVLAVDDDAFNILAIESLLQRFGIQSIDHALNGSEALKKIKQKAENSCHNRYKIIFMDCQMPIMNGYETTREIRNLIKQKVIPEQLIIGVTGNVDKDSLSECISSGMNDTISKPLTRQIFNEKLLKWLV